jgi:hypothetical protein
MALGMVEDNRFDPRIAALAMPSEKTNAVSAIGDALFKYSENDKKNQLFDLQKKNADLDIATKQQSYDFNAAYNPKKIEEADLMIAGKQTENKKNDLLTQDAQMSLDDKRAAKVLYGEIKPYLSNKKVTDAFFGNNQGFDYTDMNGNIVKVSPAQIQYAKKLFDDEAQAKLESSAKIGKLKAETTEAYAKAGAYSAKANTPKGLDIKNIKDVAENASKTGVAVNAVQNILNNYDSSAVGFLDTLFANARSTAGINAFGSGPDDTARNQNLQAELEKLKGVASTLYAKGGKLSNQDQARVDNMFPTVWKREDEFKSKLVAGVDDLIKGYETRLKTYNPQEETQATAATWMGELEALKALKPKLQEKLYGTQKTANTENKTTGNYQDTGIRSGGKQSQRPSLDSFMK